MISFLHTLMTRGLVGLIVPDGKGSG